MEKELKNDYHLVTYEKELEDTKSLVDMLRKSKWVSSDTILVNCSPDYSSRLVQVVNHKLSSLNGNELFESINLEMPYPNMAQVWDPEEKTYRLYIKYLSDWVRRQVSSYYRYLFLSLDVTDTSNFPRLRTMIRSKLEPDRYRFATLYLQENDLFSPDFFVEKTQGKLAFQWENLDNPNWNY